MPLIFVFVDEPPPKWLANTAELIGSMSIPLMLIALGVSLSRLGIVNLKQSFGWVWREYLLDFVWVFFFLLFSAYRGQLVVS